MPIDFNNLDKEFTQITGAQVFVEDIFQEKIANYLKKGDSVADVGCGYALIFRKLLKAVGEDGKLIGVDVAISTLRKAGKLFKEAAGAENASFVRATATHIPLKANSVDLSLCLNVLLLAPNISDNADELFIKELARITKKGGYVVVSFANLVFVRLLNSIALLTNPNLSGLASSDRPISDLSRTSRNGNLLYRSHSEKWALSMFEKYGLKLIDTHKDFADRIDLPSSYYSIDFLAEELKKTPLAYFFIAKKL